MMRGITEVEYIFICTGKSCKKNGSKKLYSQLKSLKKNEFKKIRVIKTKCMDYCKLGPNVVVHNDLYHNATVGEIQAALNN